MTSSRDSSHLRSAVPLAVSQAAERWQTAQVASQLKYCAEIGIRTSLHHSGIGSRCATGTEGEQPLGGSAGIGGPSQVNSAFRGSLALSGMATTQTKSDAYVSEWLASATEDGPYFQATLRVLFLQLAAGSFPSTL